MISWYLLPGEWKAKNDCRQESPRLWHEVYTCLLVCERQLTLTAHSCYETYQTCTKLNKYFYFSHWHRHDNVLSPTKFDIYVLSQTCQKATGDHAFTQAESWPFWTTQSWKQIKKKNHASLWLYFCSARGQSITSHDALLDLTKPQWQADKHISTLIFIYLFGYSKATSPQRVSHALGVLLRFVLRFVRSETAKTKRLHKKLWDAASSFWLGRLICFLPPCAPQHISFGLKRQTACAGLLFIVKSDVRSWKWSCSTALSTPFVHVYSLFIATGSPAVLPEDRSQLSCPRTVVAAGRGKEKEPPPRPPHTHTFHERTNTPTYAGTGTRQGQLITPLYSLSEHR